MDRNEFMELVYETFADEPDNVLANGIIEAADVYAEHEKAQLYCEGTTSDLISKTKTVEHLRITLGDTVPIADYDDGYVDGVQFAINTVSTMPTIQPQSTTGKLNDGARSTAQSTDLIDRQQAIDALMAAIDDVGILDGADIKVVFDNLPSAQPEPQWIPVSERLPEDLSEVNVTWVNHNPEPYYEFTKDKPFAATAVYYKGEWYWYSATCVDYLEEYGRCDWNKIDEAIEIIAWMPLPEPYTK